MAPLWLQACILGVVQGIAEFLPISSSAHLVFIPEVMGWPEMGKEFDVALHFGTLIAILIYFRDDVMTQIRALPGLVPGWIQAQRQGAPSPLAALPFPQRLVGMVILASIPAGVVGLLLHHYKLEQMFDNLGTISLFLALIALAMQGAEKLGSQSYELKELTAQGAGLIGIAQMCALMPGVSRSGSTMVMGLLLGLTRAEAARFSFLMALPVTSGACLLEGMKIVKKIGQSTDLSWLTPFFIGIVVSAVSGWLCIRFLMRYLRTHTFTPFVIYRLVLAATLFGWWMSHRN